MGRKGLIVQLIVLQQIWLPLDCFATNVLKVERGGGGGGWSELTYFSNVQ